MVNKQITNPPTEAIWVMSINKFVLRVFYRFTYNCEISGSLVANILLNFLEFYISNRIIRKVNLQIFCYRFTKVIFDEIIRTNFINNFGCFERLKEIPTSSFDDYHFEKTELVFYFFYDCQKIITVVKSTPKIQGDIFFSHNHLNPKKMFNSLWKKNQASY